MTFRKWPSEIDALKNTQGNYTLRKSYIFPCTHKGELYTLTHTRELYNQQETDPHSYPHHIMIFTVPISALRYEYGPCQCVRGYDSDRWYLPDVSMCVAWVWFAEGITKIFLCEQKFWGHHFLWVTFWASLSALSAFFWVQFWYAPSKFTLANFVIDYTPYMVCVINRPCPKILPISLVSPSLMYCTRST